ncbi:MAG: U32 family peptidase [Akkermansiaceae bacterium]
MTELLAPAGNWDCARAAVANGADAIFFGLPRFNARMRADNFTEEDLPELMDFLHRHGVRGFVAFNTLVFPSELGVAVEQIEMMARAGVDAVIVQDLGAAKLVKEIAPDIEVHASTQMTITSPEGLAFIDELIGLERAVLARELSVEEIARVNKKNDVPLEVFVHGALCVAYSGQCLTSESLGQRSANRGECAQACRMPYELVVDGETKPMGEVRYLLSPQDLAAVDLIPDLVKAGVVSFKIEGRLKSPEYVAAVTRVYRKALDDVEITDHDRHILEMMFSRGLSSGWLGGTNHPKLTHGKWGKKRGAFVGKITASGQGWIAIDEPEVPIEPGNGFVIDAGEDRNKEQGGMVWKIEGGRLDFDRRVNIDWDRVKPGQGLWKTSDPKLDAAVRKTWKGGRLIEKGDALEISASGRVGEPLVLKCRGKEVSSEILLEKAERRPLGQEVLEAQLSRLGGTGFALGSVTCEIEGEVIIPLGELNRCRRRLVELLVAERVVNDGSAILKTILPSAKASENEVELRVLCRSLAQVHGSLIAGARFIYCDFEDLRLYKEAVALVREFGGEVFLATPRIQKPSEVGYFKLITNAEPDGVLVRNLGAISFFKDSDLRLIGDFSLNVANPLTAKLLMESGGFENLTISYDLNEGQVGEMLAGTPADWLELTVHQHMPMFHMEHCVFCTFLSEGTSIKDCGKPCATHKVQLRDRVGQLHTLSADVGCRNTLFNGLAQTGVGSVEGFQKKGLRRFRLELLEEDEEEAQQLVQVYKRFFAKERTARDVASQLGAIERLGVTKGTLEQRREEVHR